MDNVEKNSILVVDDEKMNLEILCDILSPKFTVYTAKGGLSALEITNKYMPDLILLDILMPDISGFEVLKTLKSSEKTREIPVIIITGLDSAEEEEKGLMLDAADFIHKPFSHNTVKSRVRNQIQIVNQIRALKQYAQDMQLTLSRMEVIVNSFGGVIWSVNKDGVITSFNGQYLNKIGISPSFLIGKNIEVARTKNRHPDIIDNIEKTFREGPQNWHSEVNGVMFRSHTTLLSDAEGNISGIVGCSDDVTELIHLHRELEAAVKIAETANRTKSSFLAKMSHEIRTPLNAVLGISEIQLQNETLPLDVKEAFTRIFNSGDLLLGIINDILDMSKIEAGKLELIHAEYDVSSIINDTVYLNTIKYESKPIEFILNVNEKVPSTLFGDELRIKQVLNNLLSNAFKYTKAGEVELSIDAEYSSANVVTLIFRVRDTGQGMTKEQVNKLFDEYSRFNLESNRATEGTGLGMGIAQNLVQMMNGEIFVESEHGKGSLFTVRLPQSYAGAPELGRESVERLRRFHLNYETKMKNIHIVREPIPFGKVLVVDDMEMNLYVAKEMLSLYGLQIDTALSGYEAIEKIKINTYDVVFMDHMMPGMDGMETTREIRKLGAEYYRLPVIALTANAVSGVREMFLANGFNGFLSKPIIIQELDDILKEWILPEKITRQAEQETGNGGETYGSFLDDVSKISEIDTEIGLKQLLGDKNVYRNTLNIFYKKLMSECNRMTAFLDAKDINNFTVSIHAMKSMLAIIGALALSDAALELETASKNHEIDYCTQQFPQLKEKFLSLHKQLSVIFQDTEAKGWPDGTDNLRENVSKQPTAAEKKPQTGKVLVVDDMEMNLYVVEQKLLRYGLQVDTALSGDEAIEKIKNKAYDIVFMDHLMPGMDGIETTRKIREWENEEHKKTHGTLNPLTIIALTANADSGMKETFLANKFNGFLAKPVITKELEELLEEQLFGA